MFNESTVTTASFPIKKVAYRNSTAAAQAAAGEHHRENNIVHRTSGSINVSSTRRLNDSAYSVDGTALSASQHEARQRQRQRELAKKKEEARKVALETARLCSTGVITTFSDFSDGKNSNNNSSSAGGGGGGGVVRNILLTKPKASPNRKKIKRAAATKIVKRTSSGGRTIYEEEKISEDDESYSSQTTNGGGGSHTITTAPTEGGDNNALPSISEEGGSNKTRWIKMGGGKFAPKRLLAPLLKNETDDHSTRQTAYQKYQQQLAQEAQDLLSSGDIWMCSLCGGPFDSLENADSHELHCVVNWIRCGLTASSALRDSNGQMSQQSRGKKPSVSFDSLDGESDYEDEQTRLFYMSARSRKSSSHSSSQQRSDYFRSYRARTQLPTTRTKNISAGVQPLWE